jgi:hypothetical protein
MSELDNDLKASFLIIKRKKWGSVWGYTKSGPTYYNFLSWCNYDIKTFDTTKYILGVKL